MIAQAMLAESTESGCSAAHDPTSADYRYHEDYTRISASMLKVFHKGPREFEATYITKTKPPFEPTPRMNLGSVCHAVFLEGASIEAMVVPYPDFMLGDAGRLKPGANAVIQGIANRIRTEPLESMYEVMPEFCITPSGARSTSKAAREWFDANRDELTVTQAEADQLHAAFEGKDRSKSLYVMKASEIDAARSIVDALDNHDFAKWCALGHAIAEEPIYWTHKASGLQCRCLPDILIPGVTAPDGREFTFFADLKITINWAPQSFHYYLSSRGRGSQSGWLQAAHYADGITRNWGRTSMRFVCANPEEPHQVRIHPISAITFDSMRDRYEKLMVDLARRLKANDWSDPDEHSEKDIVLTEEDLG